MTPEQLITGRTDGLRMIEVEDREYDWKCVECGFEITSSTRPGICPECNCSSGDLPRHLNLFIRAEAMGFKPGFVTWWRQEGSRKK